MNYSFAEDDNYIYNTTFEENNHVCPEEETNILHNTEYDTNNNTRLSKPLQEITNCEEKNSSRVKNDKSKLINTDKGKCSNFNIIFILVTFYK